MQICRPVCWPCLAAAAERSTVDASERCAAQAASPCAAQSASPCTALSGQAVDDPAGACSASRLRPSPLRIDSRTANTAIVRHRVATKHRPQHTTTVASEPGRHATTTGTTKKVETPRAPTDEADEGNALGLVCGLAHRRALASIKRGAHQWGLTPRVMHPPCALSRLATPTPTLEVAEAVVASPRRDSPAHPPPVKGSLRRYAPLTGFLLAPTTRLYGSTPGSVMARRSPTSCAAISSQVGVYVRLVAYSRAELARFSARRYSVTVWPRALISSSICVRSSR
jgi:hypothetical protein